MEHEATTVALLHHVGGGNLGDDATLDAVIRNISARWPGTSVVVFCLNPADTQQRHGVTAYPARRRTWSFGYQPDGTAVPSRATIKALVKRYTPLFGALRAAYRLAVLPIAFYREGAFLASSFKRLRQCQMLIVCGGGQLTEWGGPWGFPYTIFKWVALAKLAGMRRVVLNVGAGPLAHRISRLFVMSALRMADYVSFRDRESKAFVDGLGFAGDSQVFPDCVYSLDVNPRRVNQRTVKRRPRIGLLPMPYLDPRTFRGDRNEASYSEYVRKLADFAADLLRRSHTVVLFGTDIGVDPLAIEDVRRAMGEKRWEANGLELASRVSSFDELMATMSAVDCVVTCRFHGVVFAHLLNKPVLALAHHPKVSTLMKEIGQERYCLDIDTFDANALRATFDDLMANQEAVAAQMLRSADLYRTALRRQFDTLFPDARGLRRAV